MMHGCSLAWPLAGPWPGPGWPLAWPWLALGLAMAGPWPGPGWPLASSWLALGLALGWPVPWPGPWLALGLALGWPLAWPLAGPVQTGSGSKREIKLTGSLGQISGSGLLSIAQIYSLVTSTRRCE